jgi:hypothetical protein
MRLSDLTEKLKKFPDVKVVRISTGNPYHYKFESNYNGHKVFTIRKYYSQDPHITEIDLILITRSLQLPEDWWL